MTSLVPADLTRNLWALGEVAPNLIARLGGNVVNVEHSRSRETFDVLACQLSIRVETRNSEHVREIRNALLAAGFRLIE